MGVVIHINSSAGGGTGQGYIGVFTDYNDLTTQFPTAPTLSLAYVQNNQGTKWLPGSMGGNFYSKGSYLFDGVAWVSSVEDIADELQNILDTINTQDLESVLTNGNTPGANDISMLARSIFFGASDIIEVTEDGSGGYCVVNSAGASASAKNILINGGTTSEAVFTFDRLLLEQSGLFDSGKILLNYNLANPELVLQNDATTGAFKQTVKGITPTADRLHELQDLDGVIEHAAIISNTDPTPTDDQYLRGQKWYNTTARRMWFCEDNTATAAYWLPMVGYLTFRAFNNVSQDLNVLGAGVNLTFGADVVNEPNFLGITHTAGTSTFTITVKGKYRIRYSISYQGLTGTRQNIDSVINVNGAPAWQFDSISYVRTATDPWGNNRAEAEVDLDVADVVTLNAFRIGSAGTNGTFTPGTFIEIELIKREP